MGATAEVAQQLVGAGADVNGRALGAFTPLHVAAEGGKLELVEVLLQVGGLHGARRCPCGASRRQHWQRG